MNILYFFRGYGKYNNNSVVDLQRQAIPSDIQIDTLSVKHGGIKGYFRAFKDLKRYLKNNSCDAIHAHYAYCGIVAKLASKRPVICSIMGSDVFQQNRILRILIWIFHYFFWSLTIVKNEQMKICLKKSKLIPNGVDFRRFREIDKLKAMEYSGFTKDKKHLIFVAEDPFSKVKNLPLAQAAVKLIPDKRLEFHVLHKIIPNYMPYYYNSADLLILTSISEGSPNVVKEAMACNLPIVSVCVGDVKKIINGTEGTYLSSYNPSDLAQKIVLALKYGKRTKGRANIKYLDNKEIIKEIVGYYHQIII